MTSKVTVSFKFNHKRNILRYTVAYQSFEKMCKLYVALLLVSFTISVQSGVNDQASSSSSPSILPLVVINLGQSCVKPDKIENLEQFADSKEYSGKTLFSAQEAPDGKQVFMCAIKDLSDKKPSNLDDYCLYSMKFNESDPLKCIHEPYPITRKYIEKTSEIHYNEAPCGPRKNGKVYRLVYKICMTDEPHPKDPKRLLVTGPVPFSYWKLFPIIYETEVEIFRFCYIEKGGGVLYTEHKISSVELLQDERLQQEREKTFPVLFDPSNPFNATVEDMKKEFDRVDSLKRFDSFKRVDSFKRADSFKKVVTRIDSMQKNLDKSIPVIDEDKISKYDKPPEIVEVRYQQEKLVPSHDFAFALWRKATFSSFNYRRMRADLVDLWNHIGLLIRQNAIELKRDYYIYTSAFRLTLENPQFIRQTPEPNVWMKKIYYFYEEYEGIHRRKRAKAVAILMDAYFDTGITEAEDMLKKRCGENICPDAFKNDFPVLGKSVRCCSLIKNYDLQEEAIEAYGTLDTNFLRGEAEIKMGKEEPSDMDQQALWNEANKRKRSASPSYDPNTKKNKTPEEGGNGKVQITSFSTKVDLKVKIEANHLPLHSSDATVTCKWGTYWSSN